MEPRFQNVLQSIRVDYTRCEKTDSTDAVVKWVWLSESLFREARPHWQQCGRGIQLNGTAYTDLEWADNVVLLSSRNDPLKHMTQHLTWILWRRGLFWEPKSLECLTPTLALYPPLILPAPYP